MHGFLHPWRPQLGFFTMDGGAPGWLRAPRDECHLNPARPAERARALVDRQLRTRKEHGHRLPSEPMSKSVTDATTPPPALASAKLKLSSRFAETGTSFSASPKIVHPFASTGHAT